MRQFTSHTTFPRRVKAPQLLDGHREEAVTVAIQMKPGEWNRIPCTSRQAAKKLLGELYEARIVTKEPIALYIEGSLEGYAEILLNIHGETLVVVYPPKERTK